MPPRVSSVVQSGLSGLVAGMVRRSLKTTFRRISWIKPLPDLPPDRPVILYANHHNFYDGHLLWLLITHTLQRSPLIWMEDFDRFPFFAAIGACPFPEGDVQSRAAAIRRTRRQFRRRPETVLAYFPEGQLHPPEEDLLPFPKAPMRRLDALFPEALWWPVALHVTWRGEPRPTALLSGGTPRQAADGRERSRLRRLLLQLQEDAHPDTVPIMESRPSLQKQWNFSFLNRLFSP